MPIIATPNAQLTSFQGLVNCFLCPPHGSNHGHELVKAIQAAVPCEAVSIFLTRDDPKRIEYISGVGYVGDYEKQKYPFDAANEFLTAYVAKERCAINESAQVLRQGAEERPRNPNVPPFSGACILILPSKEIRNLIAVPILCHAERCVGVLKLENFSDKSKAIFPDEAFALAQTIAGWIGIGYRQRSYGRFWHFWATRDVRPRDHGDLSAIAEFLATEVGAECASFFVEESSEEGPVLRYRGGTGYSKEYETHEYRLDSKSFTAFVARIKQAVRMKHSELVAAAAAGRIPFKGDCKNYIESGFFRDIMAIPVLAGDGNSCVAVVKLENKIPAHETFDDVDLLVCREFAQQEVLRRLRQTPATSIGRAAILREALGPQLSDDQKPTSDVYEKAIEFYLSRPGDFREKEIAAWLNIAEKTFTRKLGDYNRVHKTGSSGKSAG